MVPYPTSGHGYRDLPPDAPPPRLCLIQKTNPNEEYGFNLHAEKAKGQFIGAVDVGSPADLAGLKKGDKIFAVNGESISGRSHKDVVGGIKTNPLKCEMLVVSDEDYEWYEERGIPVDMTLPNIIQVCKEFYEEPCMSRSSVTVDLPRRTTVSIKSTDSPTAKVYRTTIEVRPPPSVDSGSFTSYSSHSSTRSSTDTDSLSTKKRQPPGGKAVVGGGAKPSMAPPARISRLQKISPGDEFGFNLHAERAKGHFIGSVDEDGIADKAGLVMGQRIVGVNGKLIYPDTPHNEVVALIKRDPLCTELLVVSEEVDRWYLENGVDFSFDNAVRYNSKPETAQKPAPVLTAPIGKTTTMDTRITMERHQEDEFVDSYPIGATDSVEQDMRFDHDKPMQQTTVMTTTHTLSVTDTNGDVNENTDDLIDKIFQDVKLMPVSSLDIEDSAPHREMENEPSIPPIHFTSPSTDDRSVASSATRDISSNQVPLVISPAAVRNTYSTETKASSPTSYSSSISPGPRANGDANGIDIFKLSAKEARQKLQKQKNDPRKQNVSLEQKYRMIANL